jgi:alkylation response protein AidB-like acyl-CoA dehydrogenase
MAHGLDEETKSIVEGTLVRFVDEAYDPHARRMRLNSGAVDYRLHWKLLAQLGVLGMPFTEDEGGMSGSAADVAWCSSRSSKPQ